LAGPPFPPLGFGEAFLPDGPPFSRVLSGTQLAVMPLMSPRFSRGTCRANLREEGFTLSPVIPFFSFRNLGQRFIGFPVRFCRGPHVRECLAFLPGFLFCRGWEAPAPASPFFFVALSRAGIRRLTMALSPFFRPPFHPFSYLCRFIRRNL